MYSNKNMMDSSDERSRNGRRVRRPQLLVTDADANANMNNNVGVEAIKNKLDVSMSDVGSKSPGRTRKSKLIESKAANFEKKGLNGETKSMDFLSLDIDDEDSSSLVENRKSGPSARRGKMQRERRKLREKRRSTGVVNIKDVEESENLDTTADEERLKSETVVNTQTNELSPVSTTAPVTRISVAKSETATSRLMPSETNSESVLATSSAKHTSRDSPRLQHRSLHHSTKTGSSPSENDEIRMKLEVAETTISKLRMEITVMDNELHVLEEENHQLKLENKMLEDENRTMLQLIRDKTC